MRYLLLFLSLSLAAGCKKTPTIPSNGNVSATINGVNWVANSVRGNLLSDGTIAFGGEIQTTKEADEPYPLDDLSFRIERTLDVQTLRGNGSPRVRFYTIIEHGHVVDEVFSVYEPDSLSNFIQIDEEHGSYGEIKGRFSVTLIKTTSGLQPRYPDTLRITNGVFEVRDIKPF